MMQAHPVPYVHTRGSLSVEGMPASSIALLGARDRTDQIELRAGIDHPADAAQNAIHLSESPESIDVNRLQAGGLRQQFFVGHDDDTPHWTNQNSRTGSSQLSSSVYSTAIILIGSVSVSITDKPKFNHSQFVAATPGDECAPTFDALTPPVKVGASNRRSES